MSLNQLAPMAAIMVLMAGAAQARPASCPTLDAFADFLALADRTADMAQADQVLAFNQDFVAHYAALYVPTAIGLSPGPRLDSLALKGLQTARADPTQRARHETLLRAVPAVSGRFARAFPDFRCDFPVYLAPTFGQMDGAGREVAGRPALVLGVDTIARFETDEQLPVFLAHDMFHRYHFQAAGFSDDLAERDLIWRTLWVEGLATYVSARLNPDRPLADALLFPRDLEAQAAPLLPSLAQGIRQDLDRVDPAVFGLYFMGGDAQARKLGRPSRAGYYLGYRVAERLGAHRSLVQLAHLKGRALRREIDEALIALSKPDR